jgi:GR25 family glycosyltransferase involved in LPS biosynthesis
MSLLGDITHHLKPALGKGDLHHMRNIDFIYMINLDKRPEKFARSSEQLNPFGICPYRFSAVNGWELPLDILSDLGVTYLQGMNQDIPGTCYSKEGTVYHHRRMLLGKNYVAYRMSKGVIGIVLSHLSILKDALDAGYETIWVMEDDIHVIQNPHTISDLIDLLDAQVGKGNWDVLFTDLDTKDSKGNYVPCYGAAERPNFTPKNLERFAEKIVISPEFRKIGSRYGTYSMILRRSAIAKIYQFITAHKIFLPYDMDFYLPENMRIFTVNEDVVSTLIDAASDNQKPGYK